MPASNGDAALDAPLLPPKRISRTSTTMLADQRSVTVGTEVLSSAPTSTCCFNLVLSTVGVGALTLPYSTAKVGWLQSAILLVLFFFISVYNLFLLDQVCRRLPRSGQAPSTSTYADVVSCVLGRGGAYTLEAAMCLYSCGLTVSYLGVVGTEAASVLDQAFDVSVSGRAAMVATTCLVVLPLSLLPESTMQHAGAVGTLCMLFVTCVVVVMVPWASAWPPAIHDCGDAGAPMRPTEWIPSMPSLLDAIPIFAFCMNAATAFVSIRARMAPEGPSGLAALCGSVREQPAKSKVKRLIWVAQAIALADYAIAGTAGYITFCGKAPENVLDGYPTGHALALAARIALALQLALAAAGVYVPLARAAAWHLRFGLEAAPPQGASRTGATAALLLAMAGVAYALDGALELPLGLTSAVCTTAMMFLFPGLCASRTQPPGASALQRFLPRAFFAAGVVIGIASTVSLFASEA